MHTVSLPRPAVLQLIREVEIFRGMGADDLQPIAEASFVREGAKGDCLFRQNTVGPHILWLAEGGVRLTRTQPDGREKVIHLFEAPALVAEAAILLGEPLPASAYLTSDARVLHIERAAVREIIREKPDLALGILGSVMLRLRELTRSLANHGQVSATARVVSYLLGRMDESGGLVLQASKKDVASYLGLQPESLSRALAGLKAQGLIEESDGALRVLNARGMMELLSP